MTILIAFYLSGMRNPKHFYVFYVKQRWKEEFPCPVSYNRFVEFQQKKVLPLVSFLKTCRMGNFTGISFMDSTAWQACHIKRKYSNRVFDGMATESRTTLGWFFGFKLHIIINDKGEIISFVITRGNADNRHPLSMESFISRVYPVNFMPTGDIEENAKCAKLKIELV